MKKMKKKGMVHIDWVVSFSIFFLYLAFIIIFLKPVRVESIGGEQLLDILEDNVRQQVYWNVTRVPLFVDCNGCSSTDEICLDIFPFDWQEGRMRIIKNNGQEIAFDLDCTDLAGGELAFTDSFSSGQNVYWIIYSPGDNSINNLDWVCTEQPPATCTYIAEGFNNNEYQYRYGLPEFISGISGRRFRELSQQEYNGLKTSFRLPANNDFTVELLDSGRNSLISYIKRQPDVRNVYVREWGDRLLFNDTTSRPVIISTKVF